ncbi:hypothetical protein L7F22_032067 [Adiantum nelumboides]|nr:hypothetical protein [Adiantum nelumboides]
MAAGHGQEKVQGLDRQAHKHAHGLMEKLHRHKPTSSQVVGFLTVVVGVGAVMVVLAVLTPVLLLLSPVLVPVGIVMALCTAGALLAGGFCIAAFSAVSWIYHYFKGRHPPGSEHFDSARYRVQDVADDMRRKAREFAGSALHSSGGSGSEAAPGA